MSTGIRPVSLFCDNVRIWRDLREEIRGWIVPMSAEFDLKLSCCRGEVKGLFGGIVILVGASVKHWNMKMDSRCGSWKISEGNVAEFLQVGFGGVPKSSLVTWKWLSVAENLHSIPGNPDPDWQGLGCETLQSWSEDKASMILNKVSSSIWSISEEGVSFERAFGEELSSSTSRRENESAENMFFSLSFFWKMRVI